MPVFVFLKRIPSVLQDDLEDTGPEPPQWLADRAVSPAAAITSASAMLDPNFGRISAAGE
jgi:hypothetical protein